VASQNTSAFRAQNVFELHDKVTDDVASFMDALGNATHTALSFDLVGEDVLITGAGPIGIMAVAICKHVGARNVVITDINDYRLNLGRECGASLAMNVGGASDGGTAMLQHTMKELGMTEGFDMGMETSCFRFMVQGSLSQAHDHCYRL